MRMRKRDGFSTADQIEMKRVRWLWPGWLAEGQLAIVDGDPGLGKSQLLLDVAARVTRGWKMPPRPRKEKRRPKPGTVIILTSEDSWESTVAPRLVCAGADLAKVVRPDNQLVTFPEDLPDLERMVKKKEARLVIIDPIMAFVGNANSETHVRGCLRRLLDMTNRTRAAVVMIRHLNKKGGGTSLYRGGGSIAWTAHCRLQHIVGLNPDPDAAGPYALACSKNNLAAQPEALGYRIVEGQVQYDKGHLPTSRVEWIGPVDVTANELVASRAGKRGRPDMKTEAMELIRELLKNGRMESTKLKDRVISELGIGASTFKKAKKEVGVKSKKRGFSDNGKWYCSLQQKKSG